MTVDYTSFAYETEQYFLNTSVMIENLLPQKEVRGREQLYALLAQTFGLLLDSKRYEFTTEVMKSVKLTEEETHALVRVSRTNQKIYLATCSCFGLG